MPAFTTVDPSYVLDSAGSSLPNEAATSLPIRNRAQFHWSQQRYLLENIKLADAKASFVVTIACAGISAFFSRPVSFTAHAFPITLMLLLLATFGVCGMLGAIGFGAWSIKPRLSQHRIPSAFAWTDIANYPDLYAFQAASRILTEDEATEALAEQVYHLSRICHRKHRLINSSILLAMGGGLCLILDLIVVHLTSR